MTGKEQSVGRWESGAWAIWVSTVLSTFGKSTYPVIRTVIRPEERQSHEFQQGVIKKTHVNIRN